MSHSAPSGRRAAPAPLGYRLARLYAWLWRFRTLPFAARRFADAPSPCVLARPFCGFTLLVDVSRTNTHRLLYLDGVRFVAERRLVRSLAATGMRVVEVGANIGYFLLLLESVIGPGGSILCLEPEPSNVLELERNIRHNRLENVELLALAAGDSDGSARLRPGINGVVTDEGTGTIEVPIRRLDSLVNAPVDLLKIDVEGHELKVLRGAEDLLESQRPTLVVEVHPGLFDDPGTVGEIVELLKRHYPVIEAYGPNVHAPLGVRLLSRYFGVGSTLRLPEADRLVEACRRGRQTDPFWFICRRSTAIL